MIEYSKLQDLPAHYKVKYGLKSGKPNNHHYYSGRRFKELYDSRSQELDYLKNYKNNLIEDPKLVEIISGEQPKPIKNIFRQITKQKKRVRDMLSIKLRYTARNNTFIILPSIIPFGASLQIVRRPKDDVAVAVAPGPADAVAAGPAGLALVLLLVLLVSCGLKLLLKPLLVLRFCWSYKEFFCGWWFSK